MIKQARVESSKPCSFTKDVDVRAWLFLFYGYIFVVVTKAINLYEDDSPFSYICVFWNLFPLSRGKKGCGKKKKKKKAWLRMLLGSVVTVMVHRNQGPLNKVGSQCTLHSTQVSEGAEKFRPCSGHVVHYG